jgi:hypothetical protein
MRGTGETFGTGTGMTEAYGWEGREVIDRDGERVGTIEALYTAEEVQRPEWAAVKTGLFGAKLSFVPIAGAQPSGEHVSVQFAKDHIKDAPRVEPDDGSAARPCPRAQRRLGEAQAPPYRVVPGERLVGGRAEASRESAARAGRPRRGPRVWRQRPLRARQWPGR